MNERYKSIFAAYSWRSDHTFAHGTVIMELMPCNFNYAAAFEWRFSITLSLTA